MYNFDMETLLEVFEGDPEKLANEFANQLNAELDSRKYASFIKEMANDTASAWNNLVDEYFSRHQVPTNYTISDFYGKGETVLELLDALVQLAPKLEKYGRIFEDLATAAEETKTKVVEKAPAVKDAFDEAMNKFFNKMGW